MEDPQLISEIKALSQELFPVVQGYRRHIHQNPELSFQEYKTHDFVASILDQLGIEHQKNVAQTGIIGIIRADHHAADAPAIALRADLDALPIQEQRDSPYKSIVPGVMHACGHDVHTSILLGSLQIIHKYRNQLPQPVRFIFQPGEEKLPGGASLLLKDEAWKSSHIERIVGLHVFPEMKKGNLGFRKGLYMASCDEIYMTINGKGGHGATPEQVIDPILIGASLLLNLQQIVSRNADPRIPTVLSFGHFEGLGATNVIPSKVELKGTFRTLDEAWRARALDLIRRQASLLCESMGATVDIQIVGGYPFLHNDEEFTEHMISKAKKMLGDDQIEALPVRMTSEDFAYYSQEIPACFFRLGTGNTEKDTCYNVHTSQFDIDEEALIIGMQMMSYAVF